MTPAPPFDGLEERSIAFAEVNGDGSEDVLTSGVNSGGTQISKLYTNDGVVSSTGDLILGANPDLTAHPNPTSLVVLNLSFNSAEIGFSTIDVYG